MQGNRQMEEQIDMTKQRMKIASLDEESLKRIRQMEEAMGSLIVALEPHYPLAELEEEQVGKLQDLEKELGVVLIAYQS
jgi:hypothetical protein